MPEDVAWLAELPLRVERSVLRWRLELGEPLVGGYLGKVWGCSGPDGEEFVLKLSPPIANASNEARALQHWDGAGTAKLIAWDEADGALLLERLRPGVLLMDYDRSEPDDELAVRAASGALAAMQRVATPVDGKFPSFEQKLRWFLDFASFEGEPGAAGTPLLPLFERCARALNASAERKTLAHGDFVAKNLLLGPGGRYVAVDPLPFIGDPCSDIGHFSSYHSPVATVIPRARAIAEATANDPDRAAKWAAVWMIGEACETWREDSDDLQEWVMTDECQDLLAQALG